MLTRLQQRVPRLRRATEAFRARPRDERIALAVLAGVIGLGIVLRLWLWVSVRPAFFGYVDTQSYIGIASDILRGDPFKVTSFPQGYPRFLVALHAITSEPAFVPLVQHAMGVASALLLYATARRVGAPVWAAVVPAAVVMLMGVQAFVGQAILSEPLVTFVVSLLLYTGARSLRSDNVGWPAITGVLVALVPIVRFAGIVLVPVVLAWFLLAGRSWRQRLAFTGVATAAAVAVLGGYTLWANQGAGESTAGATSWPLYARVAGFADCREFTPPPGTRVLCDPTPPGQRLQGGNDYLYSVVTSPAYRALANGEATPEDVREFTFAVLRNQPLDYLWAITLDQLRWIDPIYSGSGRGQEWEGFMIQMVDGADATAATGTGGAALLQECQRGRSAAGVGAHHPARRPAGHRAVRVGGGRAAGADRPREGGRAVLLPGDRGAGHRPGQPADVAGPLRHSRRHPPRLGGGHRGLGGRRADTAPPRTRVP
jgi:hypothetical protein